VVTTFVFWPKSFDQLEATVNMESEEVVVVTGESAIILSSSARPWRIIFLSSIDAAADSLTNSSLISLM
jgi:hypothetical protein